MTTKYTIALSILTYNRPQLLEDLLNSIDSFCHQMDEIIVVDNNSTPTIDYMINKYRNIKFILLDENIGTGARNRGILACSSDIVITLDDDVFELTSNDLKTLNEKFSQPDVGAVCFKVLDNNNNVINWCHHRIMESFSNTEFVTDEISEGAVAFRRSVAIEAGLYPEEFFISHEGPDLALRIMNTGHKIIYTPDIYVRHSSSTIGRPNWRRYYYDTRNLIWLVIRNYPMLLGVNRLIIGLTAMALYSIRDGYFIYWIKGIYSGICGIKQAYSRRSPMSTHTRQILNQISNYRPSLIYMIRRRLLKKGVKI